ncbi:MAG: hypothetical protein PHN78_07695 [Dehalococcoidales bacterium]|nr:hypothetical protein [Dehalococcoidales bacterium]
MDIICGKCGEHFSTIESSRKHIGHCSQSSKDEAIHWVQSKKSDLTSGEWDALVKLINSKDKSARKKSAHLKNKQRKVDRAKWDVFVRLINTENKDTPKESS